MKNIIWDFDGTIADSLPLALELFYEWAKVEPFPPEEVQRLRNMSLKDVIHDVGVPLWKVPGILVKGRTKFGKRIVEVPIFKGIPEVLKSLHESGHDMYVMSSNSASNINKFLKTNKVDPYFKVVHGNAALFGKAASLRAITRKNKIDLDDCYYIGDEVRDVDAAKKARIESVAVTWGYNTAEILRSHKPDHMASEPAQLLKLLQ